MKESTNLYNRTTRGFGLLEGYLSRRRAKVAEKLIPAVSRQGRILDLGCGSYPYFLFRVNFKEKYGIDPCVDHRLGEGTEGLNLLREDIVGEPLPFSADFFDAAVLLAVVEHLPEEKVAPLFAEVQRVLKPSGILVVTTPAFWTEPLLRLLAFLRLVSPQEIAEHEKLYTRGELAAMLKEEGFKRVESGWFELGMNTWFAAEK